MNKKSFNEKLNLSLHSGNKHSIYEITKWYNELLNMLEHSYFQKSSLKHPRHLGDSREYDLIEIISKMIPGRMKIAKGYCQDRIAGLSYEQDCIFYDSLKYAPLMQTSEVSYLPVESVYSSIEIKSNLTLDELRKCILNCLSIKKLSRSYEEKQKHAPIQLEKMNDENKIIYSVFAYNSKYSIEKIAEMLEELNSEIPHDLQINMIYVLKKGLILPQNSDKSISLEYKNILNQSGKYTTVSRLANREDEHLKVLPFMLFISYMIDHFNDWCDKRVKVSYSRYVFDQVIFQEWFEKAMAEQKKNDD